MVEQLQDESAPSENALDSEAQLRLKEYRKACRLMAAMQKQWLTQDEAAFYCGVSSSQFRKHRREFEFPVYGGVGKYLFSRRDLDALIEATQSVPTTGARGEGISAQLRYRPEFDENTGTSREKRARKLAKLRSSY